jgi:hypothetical protein
MDGLFCLGPSVVELLPSHGQGQGGGVVNAMPSSKAPPHPSLSLIAIYLFTSQLSPLDRLTLPPTASQEPSTRSSSCVGAGPRLRHPPPSSVHTQIPEQPLLQSSGVHLAAISLFRQYLTVGPFKLRTVSLFLCRSPVRTFAIFSTSPTGEHFQLLGQVTDLKSLSSYAWFLDPSNE